MSVTLAPTPVLRSLGDAAALLGRVGWGCYRQPAAELPSRGS